MTGMTSDSLPPEITFKIISFLSPRDVVRLRAVSKHFRDLTYSPLLWRTLYTNAHLPRSPGPFLTQSTRFLERSLIESERLAEWWMTRPMQYKSIVEVPIDALPNGPLKIFNDKWLVSFEAPGKFMIHNLDRRTVQTVWCSRQVHGKPGNLDFLWDYWDACSVTSLEGPVLYIMFRHSTPLSSWKLLEFRVDRDTGNPYQSLSLTAPETLIHDEVRLVGGHGPFLRIKKFVFHADKRRLYRIPPLCGVLNSLPPESSPMKNHTLLTKTHIIILAPFLRFDYTESFRSHVVTIVQAFRLPACGDSDPGALRLSHEGVLYRSKKLQFVHVIRNSSIDPINGATGIRLLEQSINNDDGTVRFSRIDLTLPKHTPTDLDLEVVLPMTIDTGNVTVLQMPDFIEDDWQHHIAYSDDGYARGFGLCRHAASAVAHFTIDASQEQCTVVATPIHLDHSQSVAFVRLLENPRFWMDGTTGKVCTVRVDRKGRKYIVVWNVE